MRRREAIVGLAAAAANVATVRAQQAVRQARLGFLHPRLSAVVEPLRLAAVRDGLVASGAPSRPIDIIARVADGTPERLRAYAQELAAAQLDVIVAVSPSGVAAMREATRTTPIVAVDLETDPVAEGWVASLAKPGGNVTGVFFDFADFTAKCLQILVEAVPYLSRIGVVWDPTTGNYQLAAMEPLAASQGISLQVRETSALTEIEPAVRSLAAGGVQALFFLSSPLFSANTRTAATLAASAGLPSIMLFPEFARDGGLIAYGLDLQDMFRQAGMMARRIIDGAISAELPVERPVRFNFIANLRTARALGLTLPPLLLIRADEVIE